MVLQEGLVDHFYVVGEVRLPLEMERRLAALGIISGTKLRVLNRKSHGAMIVFVRGTRFAVGRDIAENIEITEAAP